MEPPSIAELVLVQRPEDMREAEPGFRDVVVKQLGAHAELELTSANEYTLDCYPATQDPFEKRVCCEMAAARLRSHLRARTLLQELGVVAAPPSQRGRPVAKRFESWGERALGALLFESAALARKEELVQSSYEPFAALCRDDVKGHTLQVEHASRILSTLGVAATAELKPSLARLWPIAVARLDGEADEAEEFRWGQRRYSTGERSRRWAEFAAGRLREVGLATPAGSVEGASC